MIHPLRLLVKRFVQINLVYNMELSITRADFAADAGSAQPIQQILQIFILTIFGKSADEIQSAVRRKTEQSNLIRHGIPLHGNGCLGLLIVGAKTFRLLVRGKMTFMQASGVAVKFQHRDPG